MTPLAICVVYLVTPGNAGLMALHLDRIARHTKRPYRLYAGVNRLAPDLRGSLERRPDVRIVAIPGTELRGSEEHAYYLDRLVRQAVGDGAEHVAVLHVDSFPVRDGWDEELIATLNPACPVAAVTRIENRDDKPNPCGLLFGRAFYLAHRPAFRLTTEQRRTPEYRAYKQAFEHEADSGVGYGFALFRNGLAWHKLARTNRGEDHFMLGSLYGDLIFHLGSASRPRIGFRRDRLEREDASSPPRIATRFSRWLRRRLPARWRRRKNALPVPEAEARANRAAFERVRDRLLADPDGYLAYLRTGRAPA